MHLCYHPVMADNPWRDNVDEPLTDVSKRSLDVYVYGSQGMDAIQCAYVNAVAVRLYPGSKVSITRLDNGERGSCGDILRMMEMIMEQGTQVRFETWLNETEFEEFKKVLLLLPGDICYMPGARESWGPVPEERDEYLQFVLNLNIPIDQRMFSSEAPCRPTIFAAPEALSGDSIVLKEPLSPELILKGYSRGYFVWGSDSDGATWGCPDPRFILRLDEFHISHSLKKIVDRNVFEIRVDHSFSKVMEACRSTPRHGRISSWINDEIIQNYVALHKMGYVHSVESWADGQLVGGLYGAQVGNWFVGESMFSLRTNASKAAFVGLVSLLKTKGIEHIDCHVPSRLMQSFGARIISRADFFSLFNATDTTLRPNLLWRNI
jgi:leucyl/phenylalanyl-tRNA---protein transferase